METGDHFKNGASPKSHTSKGHRVFKAIVCFVALMCTAQIYAQQQDGEELRRHIRYAQTAYNSGNYPNALAEYQTALKLAPNYPELYKAIGDVCEKLAATADLKAAIAHYQRYLELVPGAPDARQIQDKIYDLEYLLNEQEKQDRILDDLSGEWVAMDNIRITKIEKDSAIRFSSDFVFQIDEIQKTGKYRVTMKPEGSRNYSDNLIEKTVHIVPKGSAVTFTFADASVYTPSSAKYNAGRAIGRAIGSATGYDWASDLVDVAMSVAQESDLPSSTQTAYTFALRYEAGKLVGMVNIVNKFADPTRQQTRGNETYEITFVKKSDGFRSALLSAVGDGPDVILDRKTGEVTISSGKFKDKWGNKLSQKEIVGKLYSLDPELGRQYSRAQNAEKRALTVSLASFAFTFTGLGLALAESTKKNIDDPDDRKLSSERMTVVGVSLVVATVSAGLAIPSSSKKIRLINQYNQQLTQPQRKSKPITELRFGLTPSGGIGLTLNF
jgi:tetratricopeptide (TPR) repeat protein